jgi:TP901 family phage tail tape measure protein
MADLKILITAQNLARQALQQVEQDLGRVNQQASFASRGFSGLQSVVGTGLKVAAGAGATALAGITAGLVAGTNAFGNFQQGMNEVFTLLPGISDSAMRAMEGQVKSFANEFKVLPQTVVPALYQALSAGVPPDNVFSFLETAQKAAVGGVTDLTTAVDGISSVVNAYGAEVLSSARASDVMFTAVRLGKTNFEQLSGSLFNVIPAAASMGVSFEDVSAGLARLTAQGTPTSVATTQLRQLFVEASKDTTTLGKAINAVAGDSFTNLIAKGMSSAEILQMVRSSMPDDEFRNLFGSVEAAGAALGVTGPQYESFVDTLDEMKNSAGATDAAFATMDRGLNRLKDQFKAFGQTALIEVGQRVAPYLERLGNTVGTMLPVAMTALTTSLDTVVGFVDVLMGKDITPFANAMRTAFGPEVGSAISDVAVALSIVGETLSSGNLDYLQGFMAEVGFGVPLLNGMAEAVLTIVPALNSMIAPLLSLVGEFVSWKDVLGAVAIVIASIVLPALLGMVVAAAKVIAIFAGLVAGVALLRNAWENNWGGIQEKTQAVFDAVQPLFARLQEYMTMIQGGDWSGLTAAVFADVSSVLSSAAATISAFDWADWIAGVLEWGTYIGQIAWDAFISALAWTSDIVGAVDWAAFITALSDWGTWVASLDWAGYVTALTAWADYIETLAWATFVTALSEWGTWVSSLDWATFITAISDWGTWVSSLDWTTIITTVVDWATWIPALTWNSFFNMVDWATYITALVWSGVITQIDWGKFITDTLAMGDQVSQLDWGEFITNTIDWTTYIGEFAWNSFISKLDWPVIAEFAWSEWIADFKWPTLPTFDWGTWVASFVWPTLPTFAWATWVASFVWPTLPTFAWATWIGSFAWPSLPEFSWRSFIPDFSWPSIPSFPGWGSIFGGGQRNAAGTPFFAGGMTLVGERGPEMVYLPRGSRIDNAERTAAMGGGDVVVNVGPVTINNGTDVETLTWRIVQKMQERQRR